MPRNLLLPLLAFTASCVAACSNGGTATQLPAGPTGTVAIKALPSVTLPTSNSGVSGTNICALLPDDQVAQITGETIISSFSNNNFLTANDARCQYTIQSTSPGNDNQVVIDVISPGGTEWYDNLASEYGMNIRPVPGIGDKAFQDFTDGSGLVALFGDAAYDVYVDNPNELKSDDQINQASQRLITTLRAKM